MKVSNQPLSADFAQISLGEMALKRPGSLSSDTGTALGTPIRRTAKKPSEGCEGITSGLFAGSTMVDVLQDIVDRIVPALDLDEDTRQLALALVQDELDTRLALDRQRADWAS